MPLLISEPGRRFQFALCWILAALPLWVGSAPASQLKPPLELSFSPVSARAGEEVLIPIYLISDANLKQPFKILLSFLPAQLTFKELETGLLARKAEWRLQPRVLPTEEDQDLKVLELGVDPSGARFFPSGVIAYARFEVGKGVQEGEILLSAWLEAADEFPLRLKSEPAKIRIYSRPVYGCFFYMH